MIRREPVAARHVEHVVRTVFLGTGSGVSPVAQHSSVFLSSVPPRYTVISRVRSEVSGFEGDFVAGGYGFGVEWSASP